MANSHREIDRLFDSKQKRMLNHTDGSNQLLGVTNGRVDKTYDKIEHQSGDESCDLFSDNLSET